MKLAMLLLLASASALAGPAEDAEAAADRVLQEEGVLNAHYTANASGRLTVLFGRLVGPGQIEAVVRRLEHEPAIRGLNHAQVDSDFCTVR